MHFQNHLFLRYSIFWLVAGSSLHAASFGALSSPLYLLFASGLSLLLLAVIFYLVKHHKRQLASQATLLEEKEEKIQWLRRIHGENEHRWNKKEQEQELKILALQHQVETLEAEIKNGSKNQVVSALEALRKERDARLSQASLLDQRK